MLELVRAGYSVDGSNVCHSSLLDSAANHIMMRGQGLMDTQPSFLLLPLMDGQEMNTWTGEAYRFVFIPVESLVFGKVGALTELALLGDHTISSNDPLVRNAFDAFSLSMRVSVNVMKSHELKAEARSSSRKNFASMLDFVHGTDHIPTPQLPVEALSLRLGSFEAGVCPGPGGRVDVASLKGHPAPCPWLLQARNANAWLSFLWSRRGLGDEGFRGDRGLEAVRASHGPATAKGCVLFPACCDVAGFASCDRCLARHVSRKRWLYPDPSLEEAETVERVREAAAEGGDGAVFAALRRTLFAGVPDFFDSDDEVPEEEEEAREPSQPTRAC
jgi:hypothetical protein